MKFFKILFAFCFIAIATHNADAQRGSSNKVQLLISTADAAGADTIKLYPSEYETLIIPSSAQVDSVVYVVKSSGRAMKGDIINASFTNSSGSGHYVRFSGANFAVTGSDSTVSLTASKRATISFIYDGSKWVETRKIVQ